MLRSARFVSTAPLLCVTMALLCPGTLLGADAPAGKAVAAPAAAPADLSRVALSDDDAVAVQQLQAWLVARGMESSISGSSIVYRRGLLLNITPLMSNGEIDRLLFRAYYNPTDALKGKPEFAAMASSINAAQNALQVFVDGDGDLAIGGSMTFVDVVEAKEFDYYANFFVDIVKAYVLKDDVVEMLK